MSIESAFIIIIMLIMVFVIILLGLLLYFTKKIQTSEMKKSEMEEMTMDIVEDVENIILKHLNKVEEENLRLDKKLKEVEKYYQEIIIINSTGKNKENIKEINKNSQKKIEYVKKEMNLNQINDVEEKRKEIIIYKKEGYTNEEIAKKLGIHKGFVDVVLNIGEMAKIN